MCLSEIVIRHQVSRQQNTSSTDASPIDSSNNNATVGFFKVSNPNPYATLNDASWSVSSNNDKMFQLKIMDVLFNNHICSLVYMHDITSVMNQKQPQARELPAQPSLP